MKNVLWFGLALIAFAVVGSVRAQDPTQQTIILYSPLQYRNQSRASVDLQLATYAPRNRFGDVGYGYGRFGDEFDWLQISAAQNNRSVILHLGKLAWTDSFMVPWLEPLAKLKPGEKRVVFISTRGKDGCDGMPGVEALPGKDGEDGRNANGSYVDRSVERPSPRIPDRPRDPIDPCKGKRPAEIRTSSNLLRANLGHMYAIHVVDDERDFYALFRIESLQRGDNCTISWKLIPSPQRPESK